LKVAETHLAGRVVRGINRELKGAPPVESAVLIVPGCCLRGLPFEVEARLSAVFHRYLDHPVLVALVDCVGVIDETALGAWKRFLL
jgi:hypothetical protein